MRGKIGKIVRLLAVGLIYEKSKQARDTEDILMIFKKAFWTQNVEYFFKLKAFFIHPQNFLTFYFLFPFASMNKGE